MIEEYKTEGFVFKKENRLEADRVFSVFTKDFGRIEVVGKSIRKINSKLRGNIEIFSLSKIEFVQGKNKKTLIDAVLIEGFGNIKNSPEKLEIAYRISDVVEHFIRGQEKDEAIFDLLGDVFGKLSDFEKHELIYLYFFWNFVSLLGHGPELSKCSACDSELDPECIYFSYKEGGIICINCYATKKDGVAITSNNVKILRLFLKKDWGILLKLKIENSGLVSLAKVSHNYNSHLISNYSKIHD